MAKATSKRPTGITQEWIDAAKERLAELPPPPPPVKRYTRQEAIIELAPIIADMRSRNFRIEDMLPVLSQDGQSFTAAALKTYLARVPAKPKPGMTKAAGKAKDAAGVSSDSKPAPAAAGVVPPGAVGGERPGARLRAPVPDGDVI